jgi:hypothetical protein
MKIAILVAVMVQGTAVFPEQVTGEGKDEKREPTIIDVDKSVAKELVMSKQAKIADKKDKVNFVVKSLEIEEPEEFGDFFDDEKDSE